MEPHGEHVVEVGKTLGQYRIVSLLGRGGMGEVYKAHDSQLDRSVALKVLPEEFAQDPQRLSRFEREAKALAALNHPHIVTVFAVDTASPIPHLTMELVEGRPLSRAIPRGGLPLERFFELAIALADGLAAAHQQGIIHRDLKPSNVMVDDQGRPKILDFGLAKSLPPTMGSKAETIAATASLQTAEGVVLGTLGYMSPEQMKGAAVDSRSDVFSLGLVLYEMATGMRAFEAATSPELISAILRETPIAAEEVRPELPHHLGRVIRRCLEKDPERRYPSAKEVRNELEDLAKELEIRSILEGQTEVQASEAGESKAYGGLVVGAVLALIVAVLIAYLFVKRGVESQSGGSLPQIQSVAVLPFDNLMRDPDQDYFVEGMHEALITDLAKIGTLRVISRTSVMRYEESDKTLPEIAQELDVDALIEGSVLRAEGDVRITAQLIDGATDEHLWAQSYDRELEDVLSLLSEVARAIAEEIEVTLTPEQQQRLAAVPAVAPAVHELFLKGQYYFNRGQLSGLDQALDYLRQVVELDPQYARGWSMLAGTYLIQGFFELAPREEMLGAARVAAERALELDDLQGGAHTVLGFIALYFDWDWATAKREVELGIELSPTNAMGYHAYADYLAVTGDCEGSIEAVQRGRTYDPMGGWTNAFVLGHLTLCGHYEEALKEVRRLIDSGVMSSRGSSAVYYVGWALWLQGRHEEAIEHWRQSYGADSEFVLQLEGGFAAAGPEGAMLARAEAEAAGFPERSNAFEVACYFAGAGDRDRAFEWLEIAFENRTPQLLHLPFQPRMDPIRDDPRFDDLLRRIGFPR